MTSHEIDVGRTFGVKYEQLNSSDPRDRLAVKLLVRAACFAPGEPIPRDLLLSTVDSPEDPPTLQQREDALRRLAELDLLTASKAGSLRMHRLVAAFTRREVNDNEAQPNVERAVGEAAIGVAKQDQPAKLAPLMPHLKFVTDASGEREDEPANLARYALGMCLGALAAYAEARPYLERALRFTTRRLGPRHWITLRQRSDLEHRSSSG